MPKYGRVFNVCWQSYYGLGMAYVGAVVSINIQKLKKDLENIKSLSPVWIHFDKLLGYFTWFSGKLTIRFRHSE